MMQLGPGIHYVSAVVICGKETLRPEYCRGTFSRSSGIQPTSLPASQRVGVPIFYMISDWLAETCQPIRGHVRKWPFINNHFIDEVS